MIRRDVGNDWWLIRQPEHARLAAELAEAWCAWPAAPPELHALLLFAIRHHDDGWSAWEMAPDVYPPLAAPRQFTEMEAATATRLWSASIATCGERSPWCGIWVSRHFQYLAGMGQAHRDEAEQRTLKQFLAEQRECERAWQHTPDVQQTPDAAGHIELGYRWVQFFDRASLWLCCAERTASERFRTPDGDEIVCIPVSANRLVVQCASREIQAVMLATEATIVPQAAYQTAAQLHDACRAARTGLLEWSLSPQAGGERRGERPHGRR
jgi:hypothetical protein